MFIHSKNVPIHKPSAPVYALLNVLICLSSSFARFIVGLNTKLFGRKTWPCFFVRFSGQKLLQRKSILYLLLTKVMPTDILDHKIDESKIKLSFSKCVLLKNGKSSGRFWVGLQLCKNSKRVN